MRTPHTSCRRGKRVTIMTKDGRLVSGRFVERKGRFVVLDTEKVPSGDVRSFVIAKG